MSYHGKAAEYPLGSLLRVSVLHDGEPQDLYRREPDGRLFTALEPGWAYTLKAENLTEHRVEVLVSVDGNDIHSDAPASVTDAHGLVIGPLGSYEFTGWRLDDETVREFIAGGRDGSVADQSGRTGNEGVVGFAAYAEFAPRPVRPYAGSTAVRGGLHANTAAPAAAAAAVYADEAGLDLATHAGQERAARVGRTTFTRAGRAQVTAIGYATLDALRALGIWAPHDPSPFPASRPAYPGETGYRRYR